VKWKGCGRNLSWPNLRYSHTIYLDQGKPPKKKSQDKQSLGRTRDFPFLFNSATYFAAKFGYNDPIAGRGKNFPICHVAQSSCGSPHNAYCMHEEPQIVHHPRDSIILPNDSVVPRVSAVNSWEQIGRGNDGKQNGATSKSWRWNLWHARDKRGTIALTVGQAPSSSSGSANAHVMGRLAKR
jgi:hypothetical protein